MLHIFRLIRNRREGHPSAAALPLLALSALALAAGLLLLAGR